jgi:predicted transcriptional regulator
VIILDKNENIELNADVCKILNEIYTEVYCKFEEQNIIIFLCGGSSKKNHQSLRDNIRPLLENKRKKYYGNKLYKIFYPEDLLIEVLNKTRGADLLSYEQLLANNSHMIVIVCESAGALVELGAFTNNEYTVDKVIAAVDKKRIKDKSFIMLGPIKYLKKRNKYSVTEYGQNIDEFVDRLSKNIRDKNKINNGKNNMINLSTIVGLHYFIQLILYYFKILNSHELVKCIKYVSKEDEINTVLFNAALKFLFQDKQIVKTTGQQYSSYKLTEKGFESMKKMIDGCTISGACDKIRIEIMYNMFYKSSHS